MTSLEFNEIDRNEDSFKHKLPVYDSMLPRRPAFLIKERKAVSNARAKDAVKQHFRIKSQPQIGLPNQQKLVNTDNLSLL